MVCVGLSEKYLKIFEGTTGGARQNFRRAVAPLGTPLAPPLLIEDLQRMRVPDWIVTLFGFNVQNTDINSQLQDELTDMWIPKLNHCFKAKTCVTVPRKYCC